jgi:hypothetical protein
VNVSPAWLLRMAKDKSGFPAPTYINNRKFWRLEDLEAYESARSAK